MIREGAYFTYDGWKGLRLGHYCEKGKINSFDKISIYRLDNGSSWVLSSCYTFAALDKGAKETKRPFNVKQCSCGNELAIIYCRKCSGLKMKYKETHYCPKCEQ